MNRKRKGPGVYPFSCGCCVCGAVCFAPRRRMECLCLASTACAPLRPNRASPCAERAGASVRTARQSEDCLRVRPPRSATALRKGRSAVGGDAARGWHGRVGGSGTARHSATADSAFPEMGNPSANAPCMAWSGYLPAPCNAASRRLAHLGAESALATWSAPPIPPALFAECRRKRCRLHLSICAIHEPCTLLARVYLPCAKRGAEAATRGGASADGGTRKTPRLRLRGATGGIPTKRPAAQARLYCAPYAVCARGSRRCAAKAPLEAQR